MARSRTSLLLLALLAVLVAALAVFARDRAFLPVVVPLAFGAGAIVYLLWRRAALSTAQILFAAVVFRLMLLWLPPALSDDAYRYGWDGLVQAEGINPYRYAPADSALVPLHDEPLYAALNSKSYYSVYPPVSQLIFSLGGRAYGAGWPASYYLVKVLLVLFELVALWLLARLVGAAALVLYALHPLVLLETAGQAHTENALLLFLVATIFFARRGQGGWASASLALAGMVKLYPFVLFPYLWRRFGWRAVWPGALVAAVLAVPYAAHYVLPHVRASLDLYARLFEFNAGFYYTVKEPFRLATGDDWSKQIGPAFRALFLASLPLLYLLDWRRRWPLARAFLVTLGLFFLLSTTVHPWYLVSLLFLAALLERPAWHWQWLGLCALGTYLLYIGGPYWWFVIIGWGGWLVFLLVRYTPKAFQGAQRLRARRKLRWVAPYLPRRTRPLAVLDLGAAEGYVGEAIAETLPARVTLADVVPMNRTALPHVLYDGKKLPFTEGSFDVVVLYFVLHHAQEAKTVLAEALRVAPGRVIVVESVYEQEWDRRLLAFLDRLANRLRSAGRMQAQEAHLHFRTRAAWRALFKEVGAELLAEARRGRFFHRQALFVLYARPGGCGAEGTR